MTLLTLETPSAFGPFDLAEWLEAHMVINDLTSFSRSAISNMFPAGQGPDGAELDECLAEIRRRADIGPTIYPFRSSKEGVERLGSVAGHIYDFLEVLSLDAAPYRAESRYNEIGPYLEFIVREALLSYMGGGHAVRFGWPGDGRPESLPEAVQWIADQMRLGVGAIHEIDVAEKDGGVDVIGWKPFADGQPSFIAWLVQVTVQATYERKGSDVNAATWLSWITFGQLPNSALAVPHAVAPDTQARMQLKRQVHLFLDRLRITELLEGHALRDSGEVEGLREWTAAEIILVRRALVTPAVPTPRLSKRRREFRPAQPAAPTV